MSDDWEDTAHPRIQVRLVAPEIGYSVRVAYEDPLFDNGVRCSSCGRVFVAKNDGMPRKHKCVGEPGWRVLTRASLPHEEPGRHPRAFGTRQLAYAGGARKLDLVTDLGAVVGAVGQHREAAA